MDVFVKEIGSKLGVQNARAKNGARQDQEHRDERDEDVSDHQAIAQAPQELVAAPADEAEQEIDGETEGQELCESVDTAVQAGDLEGCPEGGDDQGDQVENGEAAPEIDEVLAKRGHGPSGRRDT